MENRFAIEEVFRPKSMPDFTYVERKSRKSGTTYERSLKRALQAEGTLISITGASKSGKTVLCHKVIPPDLLVDLSGSQIQKQEDFWQQISEKLDLPEETQTTTVEQRTDGMKAGIKGNAALVLANGEYSRTNASGVNRAVKTGRNNSVIMKGIIEQKKVLVIDDFHYIEKEVQLYIARTLKTELFKGLKAILLSLPHRSDDAVKQNSDLIGRTTYIEIEPWDKEELGQIAALGFDKLEMGITEEEKERLAVESIGSPQLMQELCLNLAYELDDHGRSCVDQEMINRALAITVGNYRHYEDPLGVALKGPKKGRYKRTQYQLKDGTEADIYMLILLSVSSSPPEIRLSKGEILKRMGDILVETSQRPRSEGLSRSVKNIANIIKDSLPNLDTVDWQEGVLDILDPFLLFYLRWSDDWKVHRR